MRKYGLALAGLAWALAVPASAAAPAWLIAGDTESVTAGQPLRMQVAKPRDVDTWPDTLHLRLAGSDGEQQVLLLHPGSVEHPSGASFRTYEAVFPNLQGLVRADLAEHASNRLALVAEPSPPAVLQAEEPSPSVTTAAQAAAAEGEGEATLPILSVNEPMYLLFGRHGDARFQLSFKYRLFDLDGLVARPLPLLGSMYFGYTQNAFWDLGRDSKPFRDTSYRPSLFWQGRGAEGGYLPDSWRAGYEHESNGRDGEDSRSIDTLFLQPTWNKEYAEGNVLAFSPKLSVYLDREDNPDIQRYRGYAEWNAQYGRENGLLLAAKYRQGTSGYASIQFDASYPLGTRIFSHIGSFVHLQWFSGYGETLLDYNQRHADQLRLGISIVR